MSDQRTQAPSNDNNLQDSEQRRDERVPIGQLNMNRKQRRKFAKNYGLFRDPTHEAWRIGNKHMKGDKQNKTITHKIGE